MAPNHADLGPVVVSAHGSPGWVRARRPGHQPDQPVRLRLDLLRDGFQHGRGRHDVTLDIGIGPSASNYYEDYVGYLPANTTKTYCWYMPTSSVPGVATAKATNYDAELQTLSLSRSAINATTSVYCAAIDNVSSVGTDVTIHTQSGL